jgi:hypothetical protein
MKINFYKHTTMLCEGYQLKIYRLVLKKHTSKSREAIA